MYTHFIGIDVSKGTLDACLLKDGALGAPQFCVLENGPGGFKGLLAWLKQHGAKAKCCLFGMEHTGIYTAMLEKFLQGKSLGYVKAQHCDINGASGKVRGKSDKIDSRKIARYLYLHREEVALHIPAQPSIEELRELSALRRRLVKAKSMLGAAASESKAVRGGMLNAASQTATDAVSEAIDRQIGLVEAAIHNLIMSCPKMKASYLLMLSIVGIGPENASAILVATHNFTRFDCPRKFASYAGLAPFPHQSGVSVKKRDSTDKKGDRKIKTLLSMASQSALTYDPQIRAFYEKKKSQGKSDPLVRNAVMNKLVHRIFAVVGRGTAYVVLGKHAEQSA